MTDLGWLLEDVSNSPDGPQVGAFFDFDGTLIDGYSARRSSPTACATVTSASAS